MAKDGYRSYTYFISGVGVIQASQHGSEVIHDDTLPIISNREG